MMNVGGWGGLARDDTIARVSVGREQTQALSIISTSMYTAPTSFWKHTLYHTSTLTQHRDTQSKARKFS